MFDNIIVIASMFEPMEGRKGKFTSQTAVFDKGETIGEVIDWARSTADREQRELLKVEIAANSRDK